MPLANNTLSNLSGLKCFYGTILWPAPQKNNDEECMHKCQVHQPVVMGVQATWGLAKELVEVGIII